MIPVQTSPQEASLPLDGSLPLAGSKKASGKSYAVWILFCCIFAIILRQTVLIRQHATSVDISAVDTFAGLDICHSLPGCFGAVLQRQTVRTWSALRRTPAMWLCGYYLLCAASFLWSAAPLYSLYRATEYLVLFSATFTVVTQYQDFIEAERAFLRVAAATILMQMFVTLRLAGFTLSLHAWHTNSYSATSAILFCYCLGEYLAMTKSERSEAKERSRGLRLVRHLLAWHPGAGDECDEQCRSRGGVFFDLPGASGFGLLLTGLFVGLLLAILWRRWRVGPQPVIPREEGI